MRTAGLLVQKNSKRPIKQNVYAAMERKSLRKQEEAEK